MVDVEFSSDALKWIQNADEEVRKQFGRRLHRAEERPDHFLTPLRGRPTYKVRAGEFRAEIQWVEHDESDDVLFVRRIGHRDGFWD